MADTKISALTAATTATSLQLAAEQSGSTVRVPISVMAAVQSDQESASNGAIFVTPASQQYHPSAAKFWASATGAGVLGVNYNLTSRTDNGTGDITFTIATDFSSADWILASAPNGDQNGVGAGNAGADTGAFQSTKAAGSLRLKNYTGAGNANDPPSNYNVVGFGDQ